METFENQHEISSKRDYLGMSEIGEPCERKLWFKFHNPDNIQENFSGQTLSIFETGHLIEKKLINIIRKINFKYNIYCYGEQTEFSDFDGNFKGHNDLIISKIPSSNNKHIIDIKSMKDEHFRDFKLRGLMSLKYNAGIKYYTQAQCYMGYSGIHRYIVLAENKNNSALWMEKFKFNEDFFKKTKAKAKRIINNPKPLPIPPKEEVDCRFCFCKNTYCEPKPKNRMPF